jgi:hypothetical protein
MLSTVVGLLGTVLMGVIAWAFNLQSRVSVLEADRVSLRELIDAKLENIIIRLDRIERNMDKEQH